jgi:hypothetical protein
VVARAGPSPLPSFSQASSSPVDPLGLSPTNQSIDSQSDRRCAKKAQGQVSTRLFVRAGSRQVGRSKQKQQAAACNVHLSRAWWCVSGPPEIAYAPHFSILSILILLPCFLIEWCCLSNWRRRRSIHTWASHVCSSVPLEFTRRRSVIRACVLCSLPHCSDRRGVCKVAPSDPKPPTDPNPNTYMYAGWRGSRGSIETMLQPEHQQAGSSGSLNNGEGSSASLASEGGSPASAPSIPLRGGRPSSSAYPPGRVTPTQPIGDSSHTPPRPAAARPAAGSMSSPPVMAEVVYDDPEEGLPRAAPVAAARVRACVDDGWTGQSRAVAVRWGGCGVAVVDSSMCSLWSICG